MKYTKTNGQTVDEKDLRHGDEIIVIQNGVERVAVVRTQKGKERRSSGHTTGSVVDVNGRMVEERCHRNRNVCGH